MQYGILGFSRAHHQPFRHIQWTQRILYVSLKPQNRLLHSFVPAAAKAKKPRRVKAKGKSGSSSNWLARANSDFYTAEARALGYKSRAAFKLLQLDDKYKLFSPGMRVLDLGFAPGAWSQVAVDRTLPNGLVLGVDILPCSPPKGASAIQGNMLSSSTHEIIKQYFATHSLPAVPSVPKAQTVLGPEDHEKLHRIAEEILELEKEGIITFGTDHRQAMEKLLERAELSHLQDSQLPKRDQNKLVAIVLRTLELLTARLKSSKEPREQQDATDLFQDLESSLLMSLSRSRKVVANEKSISISPLAVGSTARSVSSANSGVAAASATSNSSTATLPVAQPVDIILSDMCEPIESPSDYSWTRTINMPYLRLANTTGIDLKDHLTSVDLCDAALVLAIDLLKPTGSFVCKFYSGKEDQYLEARLRKVFNRVFREKPKASRAESREAYLVGLDKKAGVKKSDVFR